MTLDAGNQPHWRDQRGFFEIWFLVIFVPGQKRALWLRYTLFSPAPDQPGEPRATLWAAAFDANASEPALAMKSILPIDAYAPQKDGSFGIRMGEAEFATGICRGNVQDQGRTIAWDLRFEPSAEQHDRTSLIMSHHLPLPTRVIHTYEDTKFCGTYSVNGTTFQIDEAPGLQKHLWGKKRIEELFWLYCSQFHEDPSARIEVTSVRATRNRFAGIPFPVLSPIWFDSDSGSYELYAAWYMVRNAVKLVGPGKLQLCATSFFRSIEVDADCDLNTLAGYVYRDPKGLDLYVAQSDIANCEVRLFERSHPFASFRQTRTLTSTNGAAIEFHLPEPLDGIDYIGWDETTVDGRGDS